MAPIVWDEVGSRVYQNGLDRGVLYLPDGSAVPWNGLLEIVEKSSKDSAPVYYDGVKINDLVRPGPFQGSMKALTYPDEFTELEGLAEVSLGLYLSEQQSKVFGLSYRTRIGNDLDENAGYKIHILYDVSAVPSDKSNATNTQDVSLAAFEWDISAIPQEATGFRPTAHVIIDSRYIEADQLAEIEDTLYGTALTSGTLIPLTDFVNYLYFGYRWKIVDNGDGTWTAHTPDDSLLIYYRSVLSLPGTSGSYASTPWTGSNPKGLYLPGAAGHSATTPDTPVFDVTDIDVRVYLTPNDWTAGIFQWIVGCYGVDNRWGLQIRDGGQLQLAYSTNGGDWNAIDSLAAVPFINGESGWVRATLDSNNGAGNHTTTFYTSIDGILWTELGAPLVAAGVVVLHPGTLPLSIGQTNNDINPYAGLIHRVIFLDSIGGSAVFDVDFTDEPQGWAVGDSNGATGVDATGKTVTINGASSKILSTLDITGDIDIRVIDVTATDWTDAGYPALLSKIINEGGDGSWSLLLNPSGQPYAAYIKQVGGTEYATATASIPVADGETTSIRWTLEVDDGGNRTSIFYTSDDSGETWTPLGSPISYGGTMVFAVSESDLKVGTTQAGALNMFNGSIGKVEVRDGIDGTIVASPDFSTQLEADTSFNDNQGNVWTVNGAASIEIDEANDYFTLLEINATYLTPDIYQISDTLTDDP